MILQIINFIITAIAFLFIAIAVIIDFLEFHSQSNTKKQKRSPVETGSMTLFFILFYLSIRFNIGQILFKENLSIWIISAICWIIILTGVYFNVSGRMKLGNNWANQIKIYKNHTLVQQGVYRIVKHPLYASLIWIFFACAILYQNYIAFLLNLFIFLPMMYYRAKQEEKLLSEQFKNYKTYQKEVGMFFPKW
jgi:protein-S-isoprenylcysteine O-methyltransferase Ste14